MHGWMDGWMDGWMERDGVCVCVCVCVCATVLVGEPVVCIYICV